MTLQGSVYSFRFFAYRCSVAASDFRRQAEQIASSSALTETGHWQGTGANAFQQTSTHLQQDLRTAADALDAMSNAMDTLANKLAHIQELRSSAASLESELASLRVETEADEDYEQHLRRSAASLRYAAELEARAADTHAAQAFDAIAPMADRLHVVQQINDFYANLTPAQKHAYAKQEQLMQENEAFNAPTKETPLTDAQKRYHLRKLVEQILINENQGAIRAVMTSDDADPEEKKRIQQSLDTEWSDTYANMTTEQLEEYVYAHYLHSNANDPAVQRVEAARQNGENILDHPDYWTWFKANALDPTALLSAAAVMGGMGGGRSNKGDGGGRGGSLPPASSYVADVLSGKKGTPDERSTVSGTGGHERSTASAPANKNSATMQADPIDTSTGGQVIEHPVLLVPGVQELRFTLLYDSVQLRHGRLGIGWTHEHELKLGVDGDTLTLWKNTSRRNVFTLRADGVYRSDDFHARYDVIEAAGNGYRWCSREGIAYAFDATGRLVQRVNRIGQAIHYAHNEAGQLQRITDDVSGRYLLLSYNEEGQVVKVRDPLGRAVQLSYDSSGRLEQVTKPDGHSFTCEYDTHHRLLAIVKDDGHAYFRNRFDLAGRVIYQEDGNGNAFRLYYDETTVPDHVITTRFDREGHPMLLLHDEHYQLVEAIDELQRKTRYEYDAYGNLTLVHLPDGNKLAYRYDERGNKTQELDAAGQITSYTYDARNNLTSTTDPLGTTVHYRYDDQNRLIEERVVATSPAPYPTDLVQDAPPSPTTSYTYNEKGLLVRRTGPGGATETYTYDDQGNVVTFTDPTGHTTHLQYNEIGQLTTFTNARGGRTERAYDPAGNLIRVTDPLGRSQRYTYSADRDLLSVTDPSGHTTTYRYDENGKLLTERDALGNETQYTYDKESRLTSRMDAFGHTTTYEYDPLGRLREVTNAEGDTQTYHYDLAGNVQSVRDAYGHTVHQADYDPLGRPTTVTDALGRTTTYRFNALGQLTERQTAGGRKQDFYYDTLHRLIQVVEANEFTSSQTYNAAGDLTSYTDPNGNTTTLTRDAAGRVIEEKNASGGVISYQRNELGLVETLTNARGQQTHFVYDNAGQLLRSTDEAGQIQRTYDANGNVLTVAEFVPYTQHSHHDADESCTDCTGRETTRTLTRTYDALGRVLTYTDERGHVIRYAYDAVGNLTELTYPDGKLVRYAYDAARRLTQVTDWNNRTTTYTYDKNGRLLRTLRANRSEELRTYDAAGQLLTLRDLHPSGFVNQQFDFAYDADGQMMREKTWHYQYDPIGRLLQGRGCRYAYDRGGNIISMYTDESGVTEHHFTYHPDNRLASQSGQDLDMDADGNLLTVWHQDQQHRMSYDTRNRLLAIGNVRYSYNAENHRTSMSVGDTTTHYIINPEALLSQVLMELDDNGEPIAWYVYGLGLLGRYDAAGSYHTYHYDSRGSTTALSNELGKITDRYTYGAYGELLTQSGPTRHPFLYNGRDGVMTDPSGLYYLRARYYHPTLKRFLTRDIIRGRIEEGQTFNRFVYVNGNPVSYIDPLGLDRLNTEGTGNLKYKKISETPADDVNKWWKEEMGYSEPPYKPGILVQEIQLSEKSTFVRVYDGENSGMYGGWFMKADDIKGLTPSQIQDKFALPTTPKFVADVELDAGTRIRTGTANPLFGFEGGGQQFDLMGQRVGKFTNPRPLQ